MNKHKLFWLPLAVTLVVISAACGSASQSADMAPSYTSSNAMAPQAPAAAPAPVMGMPAKGMDSVAESGGVRNTAQPNAAIPADRKMVEYRSLSIETKEFDDALEEIFRIIEESGGYIENQNVSGISMFDRGGYNERIVQESGGYNERSASMTARIPAAKLAQVVGTMGKTGNVVSTSSNIDDITDSYFDTKARLESLTLQEERLLVILEKAEKLEDVITLEKALSDVRYQIESMTAAMRRMDSQVSFSYLTISLREVVEYQVIENLPKSFGERITIAWNRSTAKIVNWGQNLVLYAIEDGPLLLINLAVLIIVILIVRPIVLRIMKKQKKSADKAVTQDKLEKPEQSSKEEKK